MGLRRLLHIVVATAMSGTLLPSAVGQAMRPQPAQPRYRIVVPGTFGGPNGHFAIDGTHILNNDGTFVGWTDDTEPDPFGLLFGPDSCWDGDCFLARAFRFKDGELTDLGALAAGFNSDVSWLSRGGLVSGEAQTGQLDPVSGDWTMHGTLWAHGRLIDLGTLEGGPISLTKAVNDGGEVVGFALNTIPDPFSMFGGNQTRAYRWKDGTMMDLGTLGGTDAMALRINERGQIAGNSYINSEVSEFCGLRTGAFLWEHGIMSDLGGFGGTCTTVSDMNSRGQVVGSSLTTGDQAQRAFLWERGRLNDLGTSGGQSAAAGAINEKGDVAGVETIPPDDSVFHATLWSKGGIIDLGALAAGGCSVASSVNSRLQVVGINSSDCDFGDESSLRAVISENGGPMIDLNTLIPAKSGVELRNASIINERGEIVAVGAFADGTRSPVLLVPCESAQAESCRQDATKVTRKPGLRQLTLPRAESQRDRKRMEIEMKRLFGPMGQPGGASKHGGPSLRER